MDQDELLEATHPGTNHEITKRLIAERQDVLDFNADEDYDVAFPDIEEAYSELSNFMAGTEFISLKHYGFNAPFIAASIVKKGEGWTADYRSVFNVLKHTKMIRKYDDRYEFECALTNYDDSTITFTVEAGPGDD